MSFSKTFARKIVFPLIVKSNAEKLFSFFTSKNKLILVYHGVVQSPNHNISLGPISLKQFEKHLSYFKENFDVIPLLEIFQMYRSGFNPKKKTIAITFDDGYENNYTNVFPLLQKFHFPATMFIITQCIEDENRLTWYDYIDTIKQKLNVETVDTNIFDGQKLRNISGLKTLIKTLNIKQRNSLFDQIKKLTNTDNYLLKLPREHWKLMNKIQINELAKSEIMEIGAHTHNHPNLGQINLNDAEKEVTQCKQTLENLIQKEVLSIAFPDGNYTDSVKEISIKAGYRNLLAVDYRCDSDESDKNILPRYCISPTTTNESNIININRNFKYYGF